MAGKSGKIFISYRREDAADVAGRICDWLVQAQHVAHDDVFMDVTTLLPGTDFIQAIEQTISKCRAMIVIISPSWLAQFNAPTTSYVRWETEVALRNNLLIIPVLVGGAQMPAAERLPEGIRALTRRNARPVRPDSFDYDMGWVGRGLGVSGRARVGWITAVSAILLIALSLGILSQGPEGNPIYGFVHSGSAKATQTATGVPPTATEISPTATLSARDMFQSQYKSVTTGQTASTSYSFLSNSGNNNLWEQTPYSNKACSFNPPPYHLQSFQYGNKSFFCYGDPRASFGDFVYTVRTSFVHGNGSIIFLRGGGEFQNFFRFEIHTDGTYSYFIGQTSGNGRSASINKGQKVDNVLGALARGTQVALFVNGTLLDIVPDTVRATGIIGVGGDAYSEDAYVNFTYAQVWQL